MNLKNYTLSGIRGNLQIKVGEEYMHRSASFIFKYGRCKILIHQWFTKIGQQISNKVR